jgi:hypothetical protein
VLRKFRKVEQEDKDRWGSPSGFTPWPTSRACQTDFLGHCSRRICARPVGAAQNGRATRSTVTSARPQKAKPNPTATVRANPCPISRPHRPTTDTSWRLGVLVGVARDRFDRRLVAKGGRSARPCGSGISPGSACTPLSRCAAGLVFRESTRLRVRWVVASRAGEVGFRGGSRPCRAGHRGGGRRVPARRRRVQRWNGCAP